MRPVRSFKAIRRNINNTPDRGLDRYRFQAAIRYWLGCARRHTLNRDITESGLLGRIFIMRTDSDAGIKRTVERNWHGTGGKMQIASLLTQRNINVPADPSDPKPRRSRNVRLNFGRGAALLIAILQRSQSIPVQRNIRVNRIGIE